MAGWDGTEHAKGYKKTPVAKKMQPTENKTSHARTIHTSKAAE